MTTPWHMARVASRRQLPKPRKMHGPVGEKRYSWGERLEESWESGEHNRLKDYYPIPDGAIEGYSSHGVPQSEVSACHRCGFHVCSCKPVEDDEDDTNPGMQWTLAEREKMARIGGIAGYMAVCRDRMAAISGFNSVARGEKPVEQPIPVITSANVPRGHVFFVRPTFTQIAAVDHETATINFVASPMCQPMWWCEE